MRLKLDENVSAEIARILAERGHECETALSEGLGGRPDAEVVGAARAEGRMLVTLDRGFGDLAAYPPGSHPGIIVLRLDPPRPSLARVTLSGLLDTHPLERRAGCLVIVQPGAVRVRRPRPPEPG